MNLVKMQSQLHKNRFKSDNTQTTILSVNNCKLAFREKSLIVASWESISRGVITWEHCGISASSRHL